MSTRSMNQRGRGHYRSNRLGVSVTAQGYAKVKVGKSHPLADANGWCYLHTLVAVAATGTPIASGSIVHHQDDDRLNNTLENLAVVSRAEHNAHHNAERGRDSLGRLGKKVAGRLLDGRTWDEVPS